MAPLRPTYYGVHLEDRVTKSGRIAALKERRLLQLCRNRRPDSGLGRQKPQPRCHSIVHHLFAVSITWS